MAKRHRWVRRERRSVWHLVTGRVKQTVFGKCGVVFMEPFTIDRGKLIYSDAPPIVSSTGERRCYTCRIGIG